MVEASRLAHQEARRRQRSLGKQRPVMGLVLQGDGLVVGGKDHFMLADHIAHSQGVDADLVGLALVSINLLTFLISKQFFALHY